jgi:hypothetical protein
MSELKTSGEEMPMASVSFIKFLAAQLDSWGTLAQELVQID